MIIFKRLKLLLVCLLVTQISCVFENANNKLSESSPNIINAAQADLDIDFTPADEDLKCRDNQDCIITEKGCCYHEKPMAIRKDRAFEVITGPKGIKAKCREFNQEKIKEFQKTKEYKASKKIKSVIINCAGRESSSNWSSGLTAQCKKDDDKKNDPKAEGKCTVVNLETKTDGTVEIWVKDPRAHISKLLKYKYGDTWGALRAEAAKLFGKQGILIYSPGKTFLDTHVVKEEEMKSKSFIMFLPN